MRLAILLVLSAGFILSFAPGALAQEFQTWSGPLTVQVKATELIEGKFITKSNSVPGRFELYKGEDGPIRNDEGNYVKFISDDLSATISIKQLVLIYTELNAKSGKILAVGVGEFFDSNAPGSHDGIAYLDFSGTWTAATYKGTTLKKPENISLVIKMGGGIDGDVTFSANPKVTLTKQQP
jgi:hypothetical protein